MQRCRAVRFGSRGLVFLLRQRERRGAVATLDGLHERRRWSGGGVRADRERDHESGASEP